MTNQTTVVILQKVMHASRAFRLILWLVVFAPLLTSAVMTFRHLESLPPIPVKQDEPVYLPQAKHLAPMSLGWRNVLADVLWFRTISYFGQHFRSDRTYPWLASMCDLVTDLDPRAEHVYRFAGAILPWEAGQADAGIRMLEKGVREFPDSWTLRYQLGFSEFFFKDNASKAVEHLTAAIELPGVHPAIARLAAILAREQFGPATTLAFLEEMQDTVDSSDVRAAIRDQISEARYLSDLENLQAAVDAYRLRFAIPPLFLQDLVDTGFIRQIPEDPFGGKYQVDFDGVVGSTSGHVPSQIHTSKNREHALRGDPLRDR